MKRSTLLLLLALLLAPVATAQLDVAPLLPKGTLLHLEITPGPIKDRGGELAIAKMWNEPEVQRFIKPIMAVLDAQLAQAETQMREHAGVGFDDLLALSETRLTVSLMGIETPDAGAPHMQLPDLVVTLDLGKGVEALRGAIDRLEPLIADASGGSFTDKKIAGRTVRALDLGGGFTWLYALHESTLIVASIPATMERVLSGLAGGVVPDSLSQHADYQAVRNRVLKDGTLLWAYCDLKGLLDLILRGAPDEIRDMLVFWGLGSYGALGYGMDLDGAGIRDRIYARIEDRKGWALASQPPKDATIRTPGFLPADTGLYTAGVLQFDKAFDAIMSMLDEGYPREAAEFRQVLETVGEHLRINVRRDLLSSLGPEYAIYLSWPGAAVIPDIGVAFQVRKEARAKIEEVIATVKTALVDRVEIKDLTFRNRKIHWIDLSATARDGDVARQGPHTLKPSFALVDEYLVITLWPQSLKNLIHGLDTGEPRLKDDPDFKSLRAQVKPGGFEASLFYLDLSSAAGFILDNGVPFLQSFVPTPDEVPINVAAFPTTGNVTRHMFGMLGVGSWDGPDVIYSEMYSPIGAVPSYVMAVGAVVSLLLTATDVTPTATGPTVWPEPTKVLTPVQRAQADLDAIAMQIHAFQAWEGRLPKSDEWVKVLSSGSPNHPEPYLAKVPTTDPWGRKYVFKVDDKGSFQVVSLGADGKPGGVGDAADLRSQ